MKKDDKKEKTLSITQCKNINLHTMAMHKKPGVMFAVSAYSVQPGHPACMLNDCAFQSVYIFMLGDRWECVRGEKPNSTADTRWTTYTLPLTLRQRSSHTQTTGPRLSDSLPPSLTGLLLVPSLFMLYHQFHCSTLWEYKLSLCG